MFRYQAAGGHIRAIELRRFDRVVGCCVWFAGEAVIDLAFGVLQFERQQRSAHSLRDENLILVNGRSGHGATAGQCRYQPKLLAGFWIVGIQLVAAPDEHFRASITKAAHDGRCVRVALLAGGFSHTQRAPIVACRCERS